MQGELFHYAIDNSFFRGRIGMETFSQASEKSKKLRHDDVYGQVIVLADVAQPAALNNLIAISEGGVRDVFTDDDLQQPKPLAVQLAEQIQLISTNRAI
jgi:hypothetical protein